MHSDSLDKSGSPRKRMSSRGTTEEESLRHFIQEAEETPKRLLCRDSRYGSFRRGDTRGSQSEEESVESTAMMDHEACLEELRSVERHQDVLLFQLDLLHDALEGAEEALADTQRENKQLNTELEREKEQRRKLEVRVASLVQEVERLKEMERNWFPSTSVTGATGGVPRETSSEKEGVAGTVSTETLLPSTDPPGSPAGSSAAYIAGKFVVSLVSRYMPRPAAPAGSSVDRDVTDAAPPCDQAEDNDESSRYEDARCDFSATPDELTGSRLPGDGEDGPTDGRSEGGADPRTCALC